MGLKSQKAGPKVSYWALVTILQDQQPTCRLNATSISHSIIPFPTRRDYPVCYVV